MRDFLLLLLIEDDNTTGAGREGHIKYFDLYIYYRPTYAILLKNLLLMCLLLVISHWYIPRFESQGFRDFQVKKYPIVLEAGGRGREGRSEVQKLDNFFFGVPLKRI